jgi:hypothetical protein
MCFAWVKVILRSSAMIKYRMFTIAGLVALSALSYSTSVQAAGRGDTSSEVSAACAADEAGCIAALKLKLEMTSSCSSEAIKVSQGLADATAAVSKSNTALAIIMAKYVATNGASCAQLAYGAVLDGTGTASLGGIKKPGATNTPTEGGGSAAPAGSAG